MKEINIKSNLDTLFQRVKEYRKTTYYREVLDCCKKFRNLAPYNAMLVYMQRPGAQYVLNEAEWYRRFNRGINPNARPVIILVPFGPVDYLFELSDTFPIGGEGWSDEQILTELSQPFKTKWNVSEELINSLCEKCSIHAIACENMIAGDSYAANIRLLEKYKRWKKVYKSVEWNMSYLIGINQKADKGEQFASIIHELGHFFCHHLSAPHNWTKTWRVRNISHSAEEFEAESVAWLICERLNIGNPSEKYLSGYLERNETIPSGVSVETIFAAFNEVWKLVRNDRSLSCRDGLLYKHDERFTTLIKNEDKRKATIKRALKSQQLSLFEKE